MLCFLAVSLAWATDTDHDGYDRGVDDCNDFAPAIHPGAVETCDGVDQNCDGSVDEGFAKHPGFRDADGDGYGAGPMVRVCGRPHGVVRVSGDCDDTAAAAHPGATEVCGDGLDDDCDRSADGCRLSGALPLEDAPIQFIGSAARRYLGIGGALPGDLDGDGLGDLVVATYDSLAIYAGPVAPGLRAEADAAVTLTGGRVPAGFAFGDVDGDGAPDLLFGRYSSAAGSDGGLLLGPLVYDTALDDVDASFSPRTPDDGLGLSVAVGDLDGSGGADMALGAWTAEAGGRNRGAAYIFTSPPSGAVDVADAYAELDGEGDTDQAGEVVALGGDLDGDGVGDLLVAAPGMTTRAGGLGAVYLCTDVPPGVSSLADCAGKLRGADRELAGAGTPGMGFADDLDGDGLVDVIVGATGLDATSAVYLVESPPRGTVWLADADASFTGASMEYLGQAVRGVGDVDSDGFADISFLGPGESARSGGAGVVYLAYGPFSGVQRAADADLLLVGAVENGFLQSALDGGGDVTGDGLPDLFVGAAWGGTVDGTGRSDMAGTASILDISGI